VAEDLAVPQHVLRFWETKFPQLKPLKRGGGRRYYRPEDVTLLRQIHTLLYAEGYTIKGAQKVIKEDRTKSDDTVLPAPPVMQAAIDANDFRSLVFNLLQELKVLRALV
jgi:DNA-binding transcriptional MerR regulator